MHPERLNRVRILAATYELAQPAVTRRDESQPGFTLTAEVDCASCQTTGRVIGPPSARTGCHHCRRAALTGAPAPEHSCRKCQVCRGSGKAKVDPYDQLAQQADRFYQEPSIDGPTRIETLQRRIERQILVAAGKWDEAYRSEPAGAQAVAVAAAACGQTIPVELWLGGHYAEFGSAFGWLRAEWPGRAGFFRSAFMEGRYSRLDGKGQARADLGLMLVASRMPARVRVPSFLEPAVQNGLRKKSLWHGRHPETARQRAERDSEIIRRVSEGESPTKLGREFSLDRRQVQRIAAAGQPVATAAA